MLTAIVVWTAGEIALTIVGIVVFVVVMMVCDCAESPGDCDL